METHIIPDYWSLQVWSCCSHSAHRGWGTVERLGDTHPAASVCSAPVWGRALLGNRCWFPLLSECSSASGSRREISIQRQFPSVTGSPSPPKTIHLCDFKLWQTKAKATNIWQVSPTLPACLEPSGLELVACLRNRKREIEKQYPNTYKGPPNIESRVFL